MKPVANISKCFFPKVGDIVALNRYIINDLRQEDVHENELRYVVVRIEDCSRQLGDCRQDDNCKHCLTLLKVGGEPYGPTGSHAWRDPNGQPYWRIIPEE